MANILTVKTPMHLICVSLLLKDEIRLCRGFREKDSSSSGFVFFVFFCQVIFNVRSKVTLVTYVFTIFQNSLK